jgi:hypothetical protein
MPIKESTQNGVTKLVCKSNGVDDSVDHWKLLPPGMLELSPYSDIPDRRKDQMIYIEQKANGIMVVDSDKLLPHFNGSATMHELAWMFKNEWKNVPKDKNRPVAGLSCQRGVVRFNSSSFNHQVTVLLRKNTGQKPLSYFF